MRPKITAITANHGNIEKVCSPGMGEHPAIVIVAAAGVLK
jgi:hypothetical protein